MEWIYEEFLVGKARQGFAIKEVLFEEKSRLQHIKVVNTEYYGKILLIDGFVMLTEKDEFVYHEMMAHIPMTAHKNPKNVLVVGGGDGGVVREVVKHPHVERAVLCEIDPKVIECCKKYFPEVSFELSNPKVSFEISDGFQYLAGYSHRFEVIIVDSTDPIGPGTVLFKKSFYELVYEALTEDGVMMAQSESPWYDGDWRQEMYPKITRIFPFVATCTANIPTYSSGLWSFCFASKKKVLPWKDFDVERARDISKSTRYYRPAVQRASFMLSKVALRDLPENILNKDYGNSI